MPLSEKGKKIMANMQERYKSPEKAKEVFYASQNAGTISGVEKARKVVSDMRSKKKNG